MVSSVAAKKAFFTLLLIAVSSRVAAGFYYPECTTFGVSCLDCYTQKFCLGSTIWSNTSCQGSALNNPNVFCNPKTSQCTSDPPPGCTVKRGLKCPRANGVFPDINNCSRYVKCQDDAPKVSECPSKHVYNQTLGKCVFQLENSDCFQPICGFKSFEYAYPGDASLYYQCTEMQLKLLACPENYEYNATTKTCQNICKHSGVLANPKNCSEFISCELSGASYVPVKKNCISGFGFNPVTGECQKDFEQLCFEIATFNRALNNSFLPTIVKNVIIRVRNLLSSFNLDYSFLLSIGVPPSIISAILLIGNYVLTHRLMLPPLLLNTIIEIIFAFLPIQFRMPANLIISVIFGKSF